MVFASSLMCFAPSDQHQRLMPKSAMEASISSLEVDGRSHFQRLGRVEVQPLQVLYSRSVRRLDRENFLSSSSSRAISRREKNLVVEKLFTSVTSS
tara:strand:- start:70 stop:357 length:288 start_codon:yes stop_codon:yes gene_type:complete